MVFFNFTSNISGKADVRLGESTGSEYQNGPLTWLSDPGQLNPGIADYYVFLDPGGITRARNNKTGRIVSSNSHSDVPLQFAIDDLSSGSTIQGDGNWSGGTYGRIAIGPGTFTLFNGIIYKSYLMFLGAGQQRTTFKWADNNLLGNHNQTMFRSSLWDRNSISTNASQLSQNDIYVVFRDLQIDGNFINNVIPSANTATTTGAGTVASPEQAGTDSWGHGIAHFGGGLVIENCVVHSCPGAGIIIQAYFLSAGTGYPYPLAPPANTGGTSPGFIDLLNYVCNVQCWGNGRQGLLLRADTYVHNYWSYFNGEAGIDVQSCAFFAGAVCWIDGIECFLDGYNHGDQNSSTYDPLGFEVRLLGSAWLSNAWIEAPYGCGDNLMIGSNLNGGSITVSGYMIKTDAPGGAISNLALDSTRANGIFIGPGSVGGNILNAAASAPHLSGVVIGSGTTPLNMNGTLGWNIDLEWNGYVTSGVHNGIVMGMQSPSVFNWGNTLNLRSYNNLFVLDNENASNYNVINCSLINTTAGTKYFLVSGKPALDYTVNKINVESVGGTSNTRGHNGGTATLTANGVTTAFTVPHLLFDIPNVIETRAANQAAVSGGSYYMTSNQSGIIFNFWPTAPASGSMQFIWSARVTP